MPLAIYHFPHVSSVGVDMSTVEVVKSQGHIHEIIWCVHIAFILRCTDYSRLDQWWHEEETQANSIDAQ